MSNSHSESGADTPLPDYSADFTRITGITRTAASRLHNAGVRTFAQLGGMAPEAIAAIVGGKVERIAGQNWAGQARELAAEQPEPTAPPLPPVTSEGDEDALVDRPSGQHRENFHFELVLDAANNVQATLATHHQQQRNTTWGGWDSTRLIAFISSQAQLNLPTSEPPSEPAELINTTQIEALATALKAHLSETLMPLARDVLSSTVVPALQSHLSEALPPMLDEALARQPAAEPQPATLPGQGASAPADEAPPLTASAPADEAPPLTAAVLGAATDQADPQQSLQIQVRELKMVEIAAADEQQARLPLRLHAHITFQLSGPAAALLAIQQSMYSLQVLACEVTTGRSALLGWDHDQIQLVEPAQPDPQRPGAFTCQCSSTTAIDLPALGRYQLIGTVYLPSANLVATGLGSLFSVVP